MFLLQRHDISMLLFSLDTQGTSSIKTIGAGVQTTSAHLPFPRPAAFAYSSVHGRARRRWYIVDQAPTAWPRGGRKVRRLLPQTDFTAALIVPLSSAGILPAAAVGSIALRRAPFLHFFFLWIILPHGRFYHHLLPPHHHLPSCRCLTTIFIYRKIRRLRLPTTLTDTWRRSFWLLPFCCAFITTILRDFTACRI